MLVFAQATLSASRAEKGCSLDHELVGQDSVDLVAGIAVVADVFGKGLVIVLALVADMGSVKALDLAAADSSRRKPG